MKTQFLVTVGGEVVARLSTFSRAVNNARRRAKTIKENHHIEIVRSMAFATVYSDGVLFAPRQDMLEEHEK